MWRDAIQYWECAPLEKQTRYPKTSAVSKGKRKSESGIFQVLKNQRERNWTKELFDRATSALSSSTRHWHFLPCFPSLELTRLKVIASHHRSVQWSGFVQRWGEFDERYISSLCLFSSYQEAGGGMVLGCCKECEYLLCHWWPTRWCSILLAGQVVYVLKFEHIERKIFVPVESEGWAVEHIWVASLPSHRQTTTPPLRLRSLPGATCTGLCWSDDVSLCDFCRSHHREVKNVSMETHLRSHGWWRQQRRRKESKEPLIGGGAATNENRQQHQQSPSSSSMVTNVDAAGSMRSLSARGRSKYPASRLYVSNLLVILRGWNV